MPLFKVSIIEERESFAFVRCASAAEARAIVIRSARGGEIDWMEFSDGTYETGAIEEIVAVPDGYAVDFGEDGEEEEDA